MNREVASKQFPVLFLFTTPFLYNGYFTIFLLIFKTTYNILQYVEDIFKAFVMNEFDGIWSVQELLLS